MQSRSPWQLNLPAKIALDTMHSAKTNQVSGVLTVALTGPPPINIDFTNDAIGGSASNALLPRFWHQRSATTVEEQFLVLHCTCVRTGCHSDPKIIGRSVKMGGNVMNDQFGAHEYQ